MLYGRNDPVSLIDTYGLVDPAAFEKFFEDHPPGRDGKVTLSREDFDKFLSDNGGLTSEDRFALDGGCIGFCQFTLGVRESVFAPIRGIRVIPEEYPDTKCYIHADNANSRTCPDGKKNTVFAKQGKWATGKPPVPATDGTVPNNSITGAKDPTDYNYVTKRGAIYVWANHTIVNPKEKTPQQWYLSKTPPGMPELPTIWCSTCCDKP